MGGGALSQPQAFECAPNNLGDVTILVATGLAREVRIIARPGVIAVACGGDYARLEAALEARAPQAIAILSSGLCGALDPALRPGDRVVGGLPEPSSSGAASPEGSDRLLAFLRGRLPGAHVGTVVGVDRIVATAAAKAALHAETGALAVDMESHVAARVAKRHGLPFAIFRAVSDGAGRSLPPAALVGMGGDGGIALGAVLRSIARSPAQIPALTATAIDAERGFRALLRGHRRLRFMDLGEHLGDMA
jgi:adenosylhomocysteine nucleosidase